MAPSSVPSIILPTMREPASGRTEVYPSRAGKQWRLGLGMMGLGLLSLLPLKRVLQWLAGGPMPDGGAFLAAACLVLVPLGVVFILNGLRGLPRLTVTPHGVKLDSSIGTRWANRDSLAPFVLKAMHAGRFNRQLQIASAKIIGLNASKRPLRAKTFSIPDHFLTPIATIVADLNAAPSADPRRFRPASGRRNRAAGATRRSAGVQTAVAYVCDPGRSRRDLCLRKCLCGHAAGKVQSEYSDAVRIRRAPGTPPFWPAANGTGCSPRRSSTQVWFISSATA